MENLNIKYDVLVVGAGVVGTFIARELSKYELKIALLEARNDVGDGCSGANSAIIHSGYDPLPGTLKSKFNALANPMWDKIADELDIRFERIGSLTVALTNEQVSILKDLEKRSLANGIDVRVLTASEVKGIEPNINPNVKGALYAPTAGIIDPFATVVHAAENAVDNGVELFLNNKVEKIVKNGEFYTVTTNKREFISKVIINCAGTAGDKIAKMIEPIDWYMIPRKGEYFVLDHFAWGFVNHTIFPLPSEKGKGILVTPTTSGNYLMGPSSEEIDDYLDVSTDKPTLDNVKEQTLKLIPNLPIPKIIRVFAGNRPTTSRHDFIIECSKKDKHFINVAGIESPGFVSAPAIAKYVVEELVKNVILLKEKEDYNPRVRRHTVLFEMSLDERADFVEEHPEYGEIVCNCEHISLGEINDVLKRNVAPTTVKGVKKRTRAGFGMCQGGFCQSRVIELLAHHYGVSPLDVLYENEDSNILLNVIKEDK